MKNRRLLTIAGLMLVLVLTSCSKGKFCECTLDKSSMGMADEVRVINVDKNVRCKSMTEIGVEEQVTQEGEAPTYRRIMYPMTCQKIKAKYYDRSDEE